MKKVTLALLVINVVTFSWLLIGARTVLPPWEQAFDDVRTTIEDLKADDEMAAFDQDLLKHRIETAEDCSRIAIEEYRRSDMPLGILTILNILGFAAIALNNRKAEQGASDRPL